MGFLIFAYRKLLLKRRINDKNFRLLTLSQQQQTATERVGQQQRAFAAQKSTISCTTSAAMALQMESIYKKYADGSTNKIQEGKELLAQKELQVTQAAIMAGASLWSNVIEAQSQAQMEPLNAESTQISLEMASLESELKLLNAELESVEKAESESAKQCTPKFGLA